MSSIQLLTPRLDDLVVYLRRNGWKQSESPNEDNQVWVKGEDAVGKPIRIILPKSSEDPYSGKLVMKAVNLVAALRDLELPDVAYNIARRDMDILCPRLSGKHLTGSLPWGMMRELLGEFESLLASCATQEKKPREYFDRNSKAGKDFVKKCRFGHTQSRSFGLAIECPVGLNPGADLFYEDQTVEAPETPFERRVIERVAVGLLHLQQAIQTGDPAPLKSNYEEGFNANTCDSLANAVEVAEDFDLEIGVLWSPEWQVRKPVASLPAIKVDRRAVEYLRAAARAFRSDTGESREQTIIGTIVTLHSLTGPLANYEDDDDDDEGSEGHVVHISRPLPRRTQPQIVKVVLDAENYKLACDAHKAVQQVKVSGWLEKPNRTGRYELLKPKGFEVLGEAAQEVPPPNV